MAGRRHIYKTQGTCSQFIEVELSDDGTLSDVTFVGGCNGNLQGISSLVRGMKVDDIINKLNGIRCGYKSTSCPDQLCRALEEVRKA
ncbi:MAG: TIGR03905 family TSCPD domain-containing protein [Prevotella sp.]|nr:TIGR03905 family TSCPD domain-containing protein [Prevotella sp.]